MEGRLSHPGDRLNSALSVEGTRTLNSLSTTPPPRKEGASVSPGEPWGANYLIWGGRSCSHTTLFYLLYYRNCNHLFPPNKQSCFAGEREPVFNYLILVI
ncbi:hypothetical protein lerEdw1_009639 [Lerista edwardsae]|nr:hypothetical protein lerEdw1_009639 [Lerista edwardsae]